MREVDRLTTRDYQLSQNQLMLNAALACYEAIDSYFSSTLTGKKALILCGPGNNGGDGAELSVALSGAGVDADVVLLGLVGQTKGSALIALQKVLGEIKDTAKPDAQPEQTSGSLTFVECDSEVAWEKMTAQLAEYDIVVDALFGTGLSRPLEGIFRKAVDYLTLLRQARDQSADSRPRIVSVDLPSGLNADLPNPIGAAVNADLTVTFTAAKIANVLPPAAFLNGELIIANIGSPGVLVDDADSKLFLTDHDDAREWLFATRYQPDSFKNTHGHVLVVAGSRGYTGAAVLCGNAAMRSGTGLVTIATPLSAQSSVAASVMPEVMTTALAETDRGAISDAAIEHVLQLAAKATVIAIGPGLSASDERTRRFVHSIVKRRTTPVVIDADGLNCLAPWPDDLEGSDHLPLIITPHPGEMLRLLGTKEKSPLDDRVAAARAFATKHRLIVVLKGSRSIIAAPDGRVFINPTGNAGLGTAGAGDTLTGIIAGFTAQSSAQPREGSFDKADVLASVIAALYIGGLAGDCAARDLGMRAMVASDICKYMSEAFCSLDPEGEIP